MKVFTRDYRITGDYPEKFSRYFEGMRSCVFDIESTGLDPSRSRVCMTALLVQTGSGIRITQFLAENHYEENRVLDATMDFIAREGIDYLITFNGQAFDVPFMNRRLESSFSDDRMRMYDFDLYRFLRRGTDLRQRINSMSQMSLEDHYGIFCDRQDTITGRESVALFDEYSLTGNSTIEKIILTHNREDVLQLHRLMYLSLDEPEDFDSAIAIHGFPVLRGKYTARPFIRKAARTLRIAGEQIQCPGSAAFFPDIDSPLTAVFNAATASYEIDVPVGRLHDEFYVDLEPLGVDLCMDEDCVNRFLILNSRTINLISRIVLERIDSRLFHTADI